jgi:hypothetical protein
MTNDYVVMIVFFMVVILIVAATMRLWFAGRLPLFGIKLKQDKNRSADDLQEFATKLQKEQDNK